MWDKGAEVRLALNPGRTGACTGNVRIRGPRQYVQVKFADGTTDFISENEIELASGIDLDDHYALIRQGAYGRSTDLRRNLTYVHLAGRLANLVYSMGITNTDFYAHQYKPLLTLLESPANGILIADEVGLGKTIEAGLIWTELRARFDMRRLLVVCPAMLREKWQDELMRRFGINATILDAKGLLEELKKPRTATGVGQAWVVSYQSVRPPKDWKTTKTSDVKKPTAKRLLADLLDENAESEPLIDMAIFDEAHYMRNRESAAYTLGALIRDAADYLVLLSATPINLKNDDLFNLLKLTDPEHFRYPYDFAQMLEANRPLIQARDLALNPAANAELIVAHLNEAIEQPLLANSLQLRALLEDPPSEARLQEKGYRAILAESLERINLLGHVLTRTRKRDIHLKRPKRIIQRERVPMTEIEREFYSAVTELTRAYAWNREISDGFLLAMPQRQVCSCPAATARAWMSGDASWKEDIADELDIDEDSGLDISMSLKEYLKARLPRKITVEELECNDSKFERLLKVMTEFLKTQPDEKVILFTAFRATALYLADRLNKANIPSTLIWGNMSRPKQEIIEEFREDRKLKVMVSTEVAAEGVDLQFCHVLVNYDLPWNPMRVEQRIGRIDRLGQEADLLHVWNLYFQDTIDDRIVVRLMDRLRIFEEALGEPEPIVGETISKLEADLLTRPLTEDEENERIEQAAQALENLRQVQNQLQENAAQMMAHGGLLLEKIAAAQEFSRRVTESDLVVYVRDFLSNHAQGHRFEQHPSDVQLFDIQLPPAIAAKFDDFLRRKQLLGQTTLASGNVRTCRFLNKVSSQTNRSFEVINQFHPLVRFVSENLREIGEHFYPVVSIKVSHAHYVSVSSLPAGDYVFCVKRWGFEGIKSEELLSSSAARFDGDGVLSDDAADMLVNIARIHGEDWLDAPSLMDSVSVEQLLDRLEETLDVAFEQTLARKQNENSDRATFQIHSLQQLMVRKIPGLKEQIQGYIAQGKKGPANMAQGKINKLESKCATQAERIKLREKITPSKNFLCAGVIRIER